MKRPQNIILILLDTHRADRLGFNGYSRNTSPNLDEYAKQGAVFERAIAPAQWTIPSHASMFSGLPPSAHRTTQAASVLDDQFVTFAEILAQNGYETVGFCNNPLVGLIHNNLKRGFQRFYNYSGTAPDVPLDFPDSSVFPFVRFWEKIEKNVRKVVDPIQNSFATSNLLLQAATNPLFVPLWTRFVHFKGNTARSIRDTTRFLKKKASGKEQSPFLLFLNLMETHLPFTPPAEFKQRFAPYLAEDKKAAAFMNTFNKMAMHWLIPLKVPFEPYEAQTLSDMYDAEVAYQDHLLGELLEQLIQPAISENSLILITADHGEMLGEHQFMGHGFGVYRELIQVPLVIHTTDDVIHKRIPQPVLTTRLFHTILAAAGISQVNMVWGEVLETQLYSLINEVQAVDGQAIQVAEPVVSEAYAPLDAVKMMERREPELIEALHTRSTYRALYTPQVKLMDIEQVRADLLTHDDTEISTEQLSLERQVVLIKELQAECSQFAAQYRSKMNKDWQAATADLSNPLIEKRLRDLGYMA